MEEREKIKEGRKDRDGGKEERERDRGSHGKKGDSEGRKFGKGGGKEEGEIRTERRKEGRQEGRKKEKERREKTDPHITGLNRRKMASQIDQCCLRDDKWMLSL